MRIFAADVRGHWKEVVLGPFFKLLEAVLELLVPLVMADIIDTGIANGDAGYVVRRGLLMLGLGAVGVVCGMVCQYYAAVAGGAFGRSLRGRLFRHVLRLSPQETGRFGAGALVTRLTNDVNQVQNGLNMFIRLGTRVPFLAIGSIVMALLVNFKIGLVFLATTPLIALVLYFIMRSTLPRYGNIQARQDDLARLAGENLAGTRVIRAFSRQKREKKDFDEAAEDLSSITIRVGRVSAALNPLTGMLANSAIILIVWLGARYVFAGSMAPGEIIALVSYMSQTLLAMIVGANVIVLFTRAVASGKRITQVLKTEPSLQDGPGATPEDDAPAIHFERVSFAYPGAAADSLAGIDFSLPQGATLGVIGGTGSGKSTLAALILRNYDVSSGSLQVFGNDVKGYAFAQLRAQIGFVPQRANLFTGTVRYNLAMGAGEDATDETLWRALETAQAADFVRALPDGLDTLLTEGGQNLSGGQRQRLTIARALARRPRLLILDDASSALDYATDAALRGALREMAQKADIPMATLLISQRAASIRHADLILVLDDGELAAKGSHEELLRTSPVYREICASQGFDLPDGPPPAEGGAPA